MQIFYIIFIGGLFKAYMKIKIRNLDSLEKNNFIKRIVNKINQFLKNPDFSGKTSFPDLPLHGIHIRGPYGSEIR